MSTTFEHAGSVSHGTLREEDLVPAFLSKLREIDAERADKIEADYAEAIASLESGLEHPFIEHLVPDLVDALNAVAPEGWSFGAHEGDGSDFGFWWGEGCPICYSDDTEHLPGAGCSDPQDEDPHGFHEGCSECVADAVTQTQEVTVIVTRSTGADGAVLVMIDTDFEPSDGLRVLLNDNPIFASTPYETREDYMNHQYTERTLTVDLSEITDAGLIA